MRVKKPPLLQPKRTKTIINSVVTVQNYCNDTTSSIGHNLEPVEDTYDLDEVVEKIQE